MKSVVGPLVIAIVLALGGAVFSMVGQAEARLAEAHQRLATLQYQAAADATEQTEERAALMDLANSGDLPAGPTLHGKPGGPPPQVNMNQFKIVIPKRGEERNDAPDAGKGGTKVRKG